MKYILFIALGISLNAYAENRVEKGLDFNQKWDCKVSKVLTKNFKLGALMELDHNIPLSFKKGDTLVVDRRRSRRRKVDFGRMPTIWDLVDDAPFSMGGVQMWHYEGLMRHKTFEKKCKEICLVYYTGRGGLWAFYPKGKKFMTAKYSIYGRKTVDYVEFQCVKTNKKKFHFKY